MIFARFFLLAAAFAGPIYLGVAVQRRWLALAGAQALLVTVVVACAAITVGAEALGALGWFGEVGLVVVSALWAALARVWWRRDAAPRAVADQPTDPRLLQLALLVAAGVVAQWVAKTADSVRVGVIDFDSLRYALPHAARLAQTGEVLDPLFTLGDPTEAYHPMGSEIFHAIAMAFLHSDALSPLLNLGWVALVLLAGWCLGARAGLGPLTLLATSLVLAMPVMLKAGAGTAKSDVAAIGLYLASAALFTSVAPDIRGERAGRVLAGFAVGGLAAGLAFGSKYAVLVPILALTAGVAWIARGMRLRATGAWTAGVAVGGGFWLLRNLLASGSPLPSADLPVFASPDQPIIGLIDSPISHYLTDTALWQDVFLPAWRAGVGRAFPIIALLAVAAVVAAAVRAAAATRVAVAVGAVGLAAYLALPNSAGGLDGDPVYELVAVNARYAAPPLALFLGGGVMAIGARSLTLARVTAAATTIAVLVTWTTRAPLPAWSGDERWGVVAGLAAVVLLLCAPRLWRWVTATGARPLIGAAIGLVAASLVVSVVVDRYPRDRNRARAADSELVDLTEARSGARFGIVGLDLGYLLVDHEVESSVRYLGVDAAHGGFRDVASCGELLEAIVANDADLVVVAPARTDPSQTFPRAMEWLEELPGIEEVSSSETQVTFDVSGAVTAATECPSP